MMVALASLMLSCNNTNDKGKQTGDKDTTATGLMDTNSTQASTDGTLDGIGIPLPEPFLPGPLDYIPNAETDEEVIFTMANLGHYTDVASMKKGPFWKLLCDLYPEIENINKLTVDTGEGDIWMINPWEENTSLAINEYNLDMFLGEKDPDDGQVYFRTENAKPILIRTTMDDPGSIIINAVNNNGTVLQWLPTQEPQTNLLREQNGVAVINYDPIDNYAHYGSYYNAFPDGDEVTLRFYADRQLFYNGKLGHYMCYLLSTEGVGLYMQCDDMECFGIINGNVDSGKFTLDIKEGTINGKGKGTKLEFEESEGV